MGWEILTTLDLTNDWQFTPVTDLDFFRIRHLTQVGYSKMLIAQAQIIASIELFGVRTTYAKQELDILEFPKPEFFTDRRLAVRATAASYMMSQAWTVQIEVYTVPLSRAITVKQEPSTNAVPHAINASVDSVPLLSENINRKGVTFWNASSATLKIECGASASDSAYTVEMGAGDYYELPFNYTGDISGVWSSANGKVLIREFV